MKCIKCGETPKTVADLHRCGFCRTDGTANEVPKDLPMDANLYEAVKAKPGLEARFVPEPARVRTITAKDGGTEPPAAWPFPVADDNKPAGPKSRKKAAKKKTK